eukprot:scaffold561581_cov39-Prasinocladus_malaysianus.AAC.1
MHTRLSPLDTWAPADFLWLSTAANLADTSCPHPTDDPARFALSVMTGRFIGRNIRCFWFWRRDDGSAGVFCSPIHGKKPSESAANGSERRHPAGFQPQQLPHPGHLHPARDPPPLAPQVQRGTHQAALPVRPVHRLEGREAVLGAAAGNPTRAMLGGQAGAVPAPLASLVVKPMVGSAQAACFAGSVGPPHTLQQHQ